jgi:hypothetical protein
MRATQACTTSQFIVAVKTGRKQSRQKETSKKGHRKNEESSQTHSVVFATVPVSMVGLCDLIASHSCVPPAIQGVKMR